ncbi:YcnI family protein [Nocardia sp. alder85J]|uniref:YcnI family protein n=1 Tax=Nocardia sp. alder85J TaxID=2862949 RepID=UPI001CD6EA2C|nr:YcnI family protein [Nocardia sp. alder85J]MCX4098280.1 YcnI family protein [Nocardia sp. alder85J]
MRTSAPGSVSRTPWHRRAGGAAVLLAALAGPALGAATAAAHVTAAAPDAAPGGFAVVTLRVPDESATAGTVKLEVSLPQDHPFTEVRTEPTPGWDAAVRRTALPQPVDDGEGGKVTDAVSTVTFTARDGAAIGPGQFGEFRLLLGALPKSGDVFLPAVQTYSDGTTVSWIERSADGTEAEHPSPVLHLGGPVAAGHNHGGAAPAIAAESVGAPHDSSDTATVVATAALIIAVLGLVTAAYPLLRVRAARVTTSDRPEE